MCEPLKTNTGNASPVSSKTLQQRIIWFRDVPIWVGSIATAALAMIALWTLPPVIENLELRDRNLDLKEDNRQLEEKVDITQTKLSKKNAELELVNNQIEFLEKRQTSSEEQLVKSLDALTHIAGNIALQAEREKDLTERKTQLENENRELEDKRNELEIKNRQLEQLRTGAEGKLNLTEKELERIGMELEKTWRISRQFILDQIISKVTEHVPILKTELRISYFPMQHPTLWGFPSGVRVPSKWGLPKDEFLHDFEMFAHEKSLNGKQFVLNEFDSQIFKLLPEDQRIQLQNKIRKFIEENNEIFLTYPYGDLKLYSKMLDASQYFLKDGFGDPSFPEKRVTEKEIKEQGKVFETAKLDVNNELERVHKIRVVLHSALDRMHLEVID